MNSKTLDENTSSLKPVNHKKMWMVMAAYLISDGIYELPRFFENYIFKLPVMLEMPIFTAGFVLRIVFFVWIVTLFIKHRKKI